MFASFGETCTFSQVSRWLLVPTLFRLWRQCRGTLFTVALPQSLASTGTIVLLIALQRSAAVCNPGGAVLSALPQRLSVRDASFWTFFMELGALVFAKMRGFPAWPAQVARAPVGGRCATRHITDTDIDSPRQSACIICAANHSTMTEVSPWRAAWGSQLTTGWTRSHRAVTALTHAATAAQR